MNGYPRFGWVDILRFQQPEQQKVAQDFAMSDFFTYLSAAKRSIAKSPNDMANVQIKSEKLTPFGGIFPIMEQFDALLA